jgi:hypothetical protein
LKDLQALYDKYDWNGFFFIFKCQSE